jgi:hypothetical protein
MALGVSALIAALGMYFLTIYGSSMEVVRHTLPAWILLLVGGAFYWIGVGDVIVRLLRSQWLRGHRLRGQRSAAAPRQLDEEKDREHGFNPFVPTAPGPPARRSL